MRWMCVFEGGIPMKKWIGTMVLLLCVALCGCSSAPAKITQIVERNELRVGVKTDVPYFGYANPDTGLIEGFEVDLARAFAKAILGNENAVRLVPVNALTRSILLENDEVDLIIATFTITEERKKAMNFSQPYYIDEIGFMVKKESKYASLADMNGKRVGVARSSTAYNDLAESTAQLGVTLTLDNFASYPEAKNALMTERVDAFAGDKSILRGYMDMDTVLLDTGLNPQPYGIATKLAARDFAKFIDDHLAVMQEDGTMDALKKQWLGTSADWIRR